MRADWRLAQPGHQSSAPETYITAVESVRTNWLTVTKHQVTKINWSGSTLPLTATCMEFAPPAHDRVVRVRPAPAPAYAPVPAVSKAVDPNPPPDRDPFFSPRPHTYCFIHAAVDFIYSQSTFVSSILDLNCSNPNPTKLEDELHSRNRPCSRQRSSSSAVWDNTITPDMTTPEKAFALLLSDFRLSDFIN
ncbi:hypothetical protein FPV67DRAFT_1666764 [Lyophyllum atratum]|nr:hypothetical protein FPV67DRAFT_1666764 [Lyophyllum atratum]